MSLVVGLYAIAVVAAGGLAVWAALRKWPPAERPRATAIVYGILAYVVVAYLLLVGALALGCEETVTTPGDLKGLYVWAIAWPLFFPGFFLC